jgi:hypothetical protein
LTLKIKIPKTVCRSKMNNFQIDMAFKNYKNDVWYLKLAFTSKVMKIHKMDYMVSLPTVDFISIYLLDNGPLYWITLCMKLSMAEPACLH